MRLNVWSFKICRKNIEETVKMMLRGIVSFCELRKYEKEACLRLYLV